MTPETRIAIDNAAHKGNSMGRSEAAANVALAERAEFNKLAAQYGYRAAALIQAQRKGK